MSDETHNIVFKNFRLEMKFIGPEFLTAGMQIKLYRVDVNQLMEETPIFPVSNILDVGYLISKSLELNKQRKQLELDQL